MFFALIILTFRTLKTKLSLKAVPPWIPVIDFPFLQLETRYATYVWRKVARFEVMKFALFEQKVWSKYENALFAKWVHLGILRQFDCIVKAHCFYQRSFTTDDNSIFLKITPIPNFLFVLYETFFPFFLTKLFQNANWWWYVKM